ncbi:MAG: MoxR family ATPase [Planctomycetota bacterium]
MTSLQNSSSTAAPDEAAVVAEARDAGQRLREQMSRRIVGQDDVIEQLLIALFGGGHALLVGVPGLAKTLMIRSLAEAMHLAFSRVQFTPDLMPADITGTQIIEEDQATGRRHFTFARGPIFTNILLADEINRTPPKTQAALLESMQEHSVTIAGTSHALPEPFFVLATQNPIEQEGTYPLPEAQLDRFMFNVRVAYPELASEIAILEATTAGPQQAIEPVIDVETVQRIQKTMPLIPIARDLVEGVAKFVQATRPESESGGGAGSGSAPDFVQRFVRWGAGPRAGQQWIVAAKVRAVLHGRYHVDREDLLALAKPVLRHRVLLNYHAQAENLTPDALVEQMLDQRIF